MQWLLVSFLVIAFLASVLNLIVANQADIKAEVVESDQGD